MIDAAETNYKKKFRANPLQKLLFSHSWRDKHTLYDERALSQKPLGGLGIYQYKYPTFCVQISD